MDWLTTFAQPDLDWGYALRTLVLRFIAVIFVLWLIQLALQLSSKLLGYIERRNARGARAAPKVQPDSGSAAQDLPVPPRVVAAIELALALERDQVRRRLRDPGDRAPSAWARVGWLEQTRQL